MSLASPDSPVAPPESVDELVLRLRELRAAAGSPSFTEITRRIGEARTARGVHPRDRTPGRVTVYDCFRLGRRRIDATLVLDVVEALGASGEEADRWRAWCAGLQQVDAPSLPAVRLGTPALREPFAGDEALLARIVAEGHPVVVNGMPGVGKSQLAAHAMAALLRGERISEIVSLDLRGGDEAREAAEAVARALGVSPATDLPEEEILRVAAAAVSDHGAGMLLDDVANLAAIEPFIRLIATPVIAVSRTVIEPRAGLRVIDVPPWSEERIARHLRASIGDGRADEERDALDGLAARAGGLPLAADLIAARVAQRPAWSLADHLDELRERGDRAAGLLEASIELSYAALAPAAQRALRLLSLAPRVGLDLAAAAALLGVDAEEAESLGSALRFAHLIEPGDAVSLNPLIRSFAVARSGDEDAPTERVRAIDRLADLFVRRAWSAMAETYPGAFARSRPRAGDVVACPPDEAAEFWRTGVAVLLDLAAELADRRPEMAVETSEAIGHHLDVDGRHRVAERMHRMALRCAEHLGDVTLMALCALHVGQTLVRTGSPFARVELLRAQQFAQQASDRGIELRASNALAIVAANAGDAAEAAERFSEAIRAAEEGGLDGMLAPLNDNLAIMLRRAGDLDGAREGHRTAYRLAASAGDEAMAALALGNLSDVEIAVGDFASAAESAAEAARLTEEQAGLQHAYALTNLGTALAGLGDLSGAEVRQRTALEYAREAGDPALLSTVWNNLGELHARSETRDPAREAFAAALTAAERGGVAIERARAFAGLAELDLRAGDDEVARCRLESAAELFGDSVSPEAERVREALRRLSDE